MNRLAKMLGSSLLFLCAAEAGATCTASWAYWSARSLGPALVRCDAPNETLTVWQQPDEIGNPVWAHSAAASLSKQHALSALDWDDLAGLTFATARVPADKHLFVELMATGETLLIGTNAFPADSHLAANLDIVTSSHAELGSAGVVVWSRSSSSESLYEIGGNYKAGVPRLVKLNGREIFTSGATLSSPTIDSPAECPSCIDFTGTLAIITGSGADHVFAEPRIGATNVFTNEGDDTFNIFGIDHLGSLTIDAGSGGANTAYIGATGNLFALQGPLLFDGGNCTDALYVRMDGSSNAVNRQVVLSAQGGNGTIAGLAPANVSFHCDTFLNAYPSWLDVHAGPKTDAFTVDGLFALETHINGTDGDDSVNFKVRHDGTSAGPLFLESDIGTFGISIDDSVSSIPTDVELRSNYAYFTDRTTNDRTAWVIWNNPANVSSVTVKLGTASNNMNIYAVPDALSYFIHGGDGGTAIRLAGEKLGQGSSIALIGGAGRDVFTMTPAAPGSGLVSINGGGEPAGCGPQASQCGDVLNYLGKASGAVPTSGVLVPPPGDLSNVVFFSSIETFDGIFNGCFESGACTP